MEKIIQKNIVDQYTEDIVRYAIYDNRKRSVPSIKDGLKPVHRRIIYAGAHDKKCTVLKKTKSASVVGTVLDKYHPHGDVAVYLAMKPMVNWFETNIPILSGQGNWGTFTGDKPAAMRYTEVGVSDFGYKAVMGDIEINKDIVDWSPNYNNSCLEPEYLPVEVPLFLINGGFGIGYGITTRVPKHNITEVLDATLKLLRNPEAEVVLIPDQCMKCEIIDTNFRAISNKGHGSFIVRGLTETHSSYSTPKYRNHPVVIIKTVPDLTYLDSIASKIEKMVVDKKLPQVVDLVHDHSTTEMKFIVVLKKGSDPNYMRQILYKNTELQKTITVNFEGTNDLEIMRMSYKAYLEFFIEFRKLTKFRHYCNLVQKVKTKLHEIETFIKVCQSNEIDNIINMIKNQTSINDKATIEFLIKRFDITDLQASYIIEAGIKKLSKAYLAKYIEDSTKLTADYNLYMQHILNENLIVDEIESELLEYRNKYKKPRNAVIIPASELNSIPKGSFKIIITENNFIKKVQANDTIGSFRNDSPKFVIKVENVEDILLFDSQGKVFKLPVHLIPVSDRHSNGIDIRTIVKKLTSNIINIMYCPMLQEVCKKKTKYFMTILTSQGILKKLDIDDFINTPPSGILYTKLDTGDSVKCINVIAHNLDVIIYSKTKALRINMNEIPHLKRNAKGSKSIDAESVDGLAIIRPDSTDLLVITEGGKSNRFSISGLPYSTRGKTGSNVIKLGKGDLIYSIFGVNVNTDKVVVTTKLNKIETNIIDIPVGSSISSGSKLLSLKNDNIIGCEIYKK